MPDSNKPEAWDSAELLRRAAAGDEVAATDVFERYVQRLTSLARSRLATKLAARVDPEDIVLSAYRSFFVAARKGKFELHHGGDLWRLLVEMTLHKLYRSAEHHLAQQRSVEREQRGGSDFDPQALIAGKEPTPEEAVAAADELEAVLRELSDRDRQAIELRLQGFEHEEIAERLNCNERTVRLAVNQARRIIAGRGGMNFVPSAARQRPDSLAQPSSRLEKIDRLTIANTDAPLQWNDFTLHEQIGAGATGRVYRATQKTDGREFAIKFLRKSLTRDAAAVNRFLTEAKTVASLAHAGIVAMHGAGQTPGRGLFLVMDRVRGPDLDRVRRERPVSTQEAVRWIAQAAETVQFAHEHGVIHCDLKPSNLLLDEHGEVRVSDFGFAVRLIQGADRDFVLAGTPAFMAPEQVDPCWGAISPRTDVWGLGGVLYFLLYGRPPHEGNDGPSTLAKVVSSRPVMLPADGNEKVPAAARSIVSRCLAKSQGERLESAGELTRVLRSVELT